MNASRKLVHPGPAEPRLVLARPVWDCNLGAMGSGTPGQCGAHWEQGCALRTAPTRQQALPRKPTSFARTAPAPGRTEARMFPSMKEQNPNILIAN